MKSNPIKQFIRWVKSGFKKTDEQLYKHLDSSIEYANQFKRFVNSPFLKGGILITPTQYDNIALEVLQKITDEVITTLSLANQCKTLPTYEDRLKCFVLKLKEVHESELNDLYKKIATWYFRKLEDKRGNYNAFVTAKDLVQNRYDELKLNGLV